MSSYWQLLQLVAPVFAIIAIGVGMRRAEWLTESADESLLRLFIRFFYPCLILDSVLGNQALRSPGNLLVPPLIGFATVSLGILGALWAGRRLRLGPDEDVRSFAFATGIYNYGYIPIPLIAMMYGADCLGVLLVYNVGCEAAVWTFGLFVLSGRPLRESRRHLFNPPVCSLLVAVALNLFGLGAHLPDFLLTLFHLCGQCAIPFGLLLIGATVAKMLLHQTSALFDLKVMGLSSLLRLGLYPLIFLALARYLPVSPELKRVIVVQGAMPAGIFSVVIAKHYGGRPLIVTQVSVATSALGLLLIPLWLQLGLSVIALT